MAMKVFPWLGTLTKAAKMGYAELLHNKQPLHIQSFVTTSRCYE